jgi:hypothetical protein
MVNLHCALWSCMQWLDKTSPIHVSKAIYIYEWIIRSGRHTPSNYTPSVTTLTTPGLQLHDAYYHYWWLLLMFFLCLRKASSRYISKSSSDEPFHISLKTNLKYHDRGREWRKQVQYLHIVFIFFENIIDMDNGVL